MTNSRMTTCIIVDDDIEIVELFTELLKNIGIKVIGNGFDGKDAEDLYKKHKPDLIFLDIMMPEYDGLYAIEKIKRFDPNAKVIIVTSDYSQETQKKLHDVKVVSVVYKPFSQEQIRKVIQYECEAAA